MFLAFNITVISLIQDITHFREEKKLINLERHYYSFEELKIDLASS